MDKDLYEIIDCYQMSGNKVISLLTSHQISGENKTSKKRSIKFSSFLDNGSRVKLAGMIGWDEWKDYVRNKCSGINT